MTSANISLKTHILELVWYLYIWNSNTTMHITTLLPKNKHVKLWWYFVVSSFCYIPTHSNKKDEVELRHRTWMNRLGVYSTNELPSFHNKHESQNVHVTWIQRVYAHVWITHTLYDYYEWTCIHVDDITQVGWIKYSDSSVWPFTSDVQCPWL